MLFKISKISFIGNTRERQVIASMQGSDKRWQEMKKICKQKGFSLPDVIPENRLNCPKKVIFLYPFFGIAYYSNFIFLW